MECFALHENSSNGQYWANATHFLYSFQTFGYPFHKRLYDWSKSLDDLDKFTAPLHHPLITALLKVSFCPLCIDDFRLLNQA